MTVSRTGIQGPQGPQGATGNQGSAGAAGSQGTQGTAGSPTDAVNTILSSGASQTISSPSVYQTTVVTLSANCAVTLPSPASGASFTLVLKQDGTGGRTVSWTGTVAWPGGASPTLTGTAAAVDVIGFVSVDGTSWLGFPAGYDLR